MATQVDESELCPENFGKEKKTDYGDFQVAEASKQ